MFIYILVLIGDSKSSPKYYIPVLILEFIIIVVSSSLTVVDVIDIIPKIHTIMKEAESGADPDGEEYIEIFNVAIIYNYILDFSRAFPVRGPPRMDRFGNIQHMVLYNFLQG